MRIELSWSAESSDTQSNFREYSEYVIRKGKFRYCKFANHTAIITDYIQIKQMKINVCSSRCCVTDMFVKCFLSFILQHRTVTWGEGS